MVATRTVTGLREEWCQQHRHGYRCPYHQDHQREEPLQQVHLVGLRQVDTQEQQEQRDEEGGQTEAALDEIPRAPGTETAAGVHELMVLVQDLTLARILNHALVGSARR